MTSRLLPLRASTVDSRISWCAVAPPAHRAWAVLVHGSDRDPVGMIRAFRPWAEQRGVTLLAPLFPVGVPTPTEGDAYKSLRGGGLPFDEVLRAIADEAAAETCRPADTFHLFGFSGGAQFAHRYALHRPEEVRALSIVAPGNVTLLGNGRTWWAGTRDAGAVLGHAIDLPLLRRIPVQALVGERDDGRDVIRITPDSPRWVDGANDAGVTRGERLATMVSDWRAAGIDVAHTVVPGAGHELGPFVALAQAFFDQHIDVTHVLPDVPKDKPDSRGAGGTRS